MNRKPAVSKELGERTIGVADTALYELGEYFSDPDDDALTYTATGDTTAARFVVAGAQLRITAKAVGSTSITVRAADPGGLHVEQTLAVTVSATPPPPDENQAPTVSQPIPDFEVHVGITRPGIELDDYFSDPDADTLKYTTNSSDSSVATADVLPPSSLLLRGHTEGGSAVIMIRATDPGGLFVEDTFAVNVKEPIRSRFSLAPADDTPEGATLTYTITADQPPTEDVSMAYVLESRNGEEEAAREGATFRDGRLIGSITFPAGDTSVDVEFEIIDDDVIEPPRDTLVMSLLPSRVYNLDVAEDTVLVKEGVCDRAEPVQEDILASSRYLSSDGYTGDLTRCAEPDSETLADMTTLRMLAPRVGSDASSDIRVDTLRPINPDEVVLEDLTPRWIPARTTRRPDRPPLQLTKADLSGMPGLVSVWILAYDLRSTAWSERIFSGQAILEQIIMQTNMYTDLPASTFEGINSGEGECPSRTLYRRRDGTPFCEFVDLIMSDADIEGTISADLLDPLPTLRALHMSRFPDITEIPDGFLDDLPELGNLVLRELPIEQLDADLVSKNPKLFSLTIADVPVENDFELPAGFLREQDLIALNLSNNGMDSLRADVFPDSMPALARLFLQRNELKGLPRGLLARFPGLEGLDLSSNAIDSLPDGFFEGLKQPIQVLRLDANPGPDGDTTTVDFSMAARVVRTDTTDLNAPGPATIAVDVPLGSPADIEFEAYLSGATSGFIDSVTATNQSSDARMLLRAGRTRSDSIQVTLVDTVPYVNFYVPSDVENTSAELTVVPAGGAVEFSGLRLEASDIATVRLFESGDLSMPRLLKPLPTIRLLRGDTDYLRGSVTNPDTRGRAIIDLADYFAPHDPSSQTITLIPDPNLEFFGAVNQIIAYDTASTSPLAIDTIYTTKITLDPHLVCSSGCFDVGTQSVGIQVIDDSTFATLLANLEVEVAEVDTTKFNIEWVDANGNLPMEVAAAIDSAVDRWGEILADVRDVRIPPQLAPRLGCYGVRAPKHYLGIDDLVIWVLTQSEDGPGGILAAAAPCVFRDDSDAGTRSTGLHQPLIGFGASSPGSWVRQGECDSDPGRCYNPSLRAPYVPGPGAIAAFDSLGGVSTEGRKLYFLNKVPTEPGRRSGASGSHWSEEVLANELMTPIIDLTSNPLSKITARIFEDMGLTLRPNWQDAVDDYCILSIEPYTGATHPCAPAMDKPSEEIGMSADEKVARGLGFDLRGDILMGPFWVLGADGRLRRGR